jgi:hypothetical protein
MSQELANDKARLEQANILALLLANLPLHDLVTVYLRDDTDDHRRGMFCGLIPNASVEECLRRPTWDLSVGHGMPGAIEHGSVDGKHVEYLRFGDDDGIEPLILWRDFQGLRDTYIEISEEFRLFHNLFHDRRNDRYYKFDAAGNEQLIVTIEPDRVKIRLLEIRQFCAVREMHLAIFIDSVERSPYSLADLGLKEGGGDQTKGLTCYGLHYDDDRGLSDAESFSRLLGKRLIAPLPKEKSGFWGFGEPEPPKYVDFIIGVDEHGHEIQNTSCEGELSNYFGANPGRPHYLTPVFFRKAVLDKYYKQPGKYSVEPSYLRCAALWGMAMDNHLDDYVGVWLGDLGRDLPYEEQLYWRSFNVVPPASGMSKTFFENQVMAEWTDTDRPEHLFKREYSQLGEEGQESLGWPILLPLSKEDEHYFGALRIPASDEQRDFDEVVLGLTKMLVDSLNEKELNKLIAPADLPGLKGSITRLEKACRARGVSDCAEHISFLRDLQDLRSSGAAHLKGSNYRKIAAKLGFDAQTLRKVFEGFIIKGLAYVRWLKSVSESDAFRIENR